MVGGGEARQESRALEPWDYACQRLLAQHGVSTVIFVQRHREHMPPPSWSEAKTDSHRTWLLLT